MIKYLLKQKFYLIFILLLIIAEPSLNSVMNFLLARIFGSANVGADKIYLLKLLTTGFLLWMLKRAVTFTSDVTKERFLCNAKLEIKHGLFVRLMNLNTANISPIASSGEYISLLTNDINLLETRYFTQIIGLIGNLVALVILGSSFFALNVKLASAILAFGFLTMFVPAIFANNLNKKNLAYSNSISKFTQSFKEYLVGYPTIKNFSVEDEIVGKFDKVNRETEDAKFEADYSLSLANSVGQLLSWFMQFIAIGFGLMLVLSGEILVATVISAQSFASDLAAPLQNIVINVNSIKSVKEIVKKFEKASAIPLSAEEPQGPPEEQLTELPPAAETADGEGEMHGDEIAYNHFSLSIEGKQIIDDFTFTFEAGKKYLVVGLNGSGKSTVFKTLKKWYDPTSGYILINGRNIRDMDSREISRRVSYLNETISLFSGSVRDNILMFRDYGEDLFKQAVLEAKVEIELGREVKDEGVNISSGEKRRIEIARSLLESVQTFIFDEVISTLDIETAYEIEKMALGFKDKTVIFISHNFSGKLIREYDEILVMNSGKLLAHGKYDDLLKKNEYFRNICEIKFGD